MADGLRESLRAAFGVERVAAWVLVLVAVGFAVAIVVEPGVLAASPPDAAFEGSFDDDSNTLRIEHAGGDAVRAEPTSTLVVTVLDDDSAATQRVVWADDDGDGTGSYPIESGDAIRIDDATIDADGDGDRFDADATVGFELDDGDVVHVDWTGRPVGAPDRVTLTLDRVTVGSAE